MQPFERLRALARRSDDETDLVVEAADCLAAFADDPAGLVVASRRLLAHHAASGALWWLCARVLCAPDPADAAWEAWKLLDADPTAARLAALLPFPHDGLVAVLGWPAVLALALADRPDLDVVSLYRARGDERLRARLRRDRTVRVADVRSLTTLRPTHLLVESAAVGARHAVVAAGAGEVATRAHAAGVPLWLVAGVGRVLPERLFDALRRTLPPDGRDHELLPLDIADRVAGPTGLAAPDAVVRRADCPVAPELLRLGA